METARKKRRGLRVLGIVLLCILGVVVVGSGVAMLVMEPGRREAMNIVVDDIRFNGLRDGVYAGEYVGAKDHLRDVKLNVTVAGGKLAAVDVTGGALAGEKQNNEIRGGASIQALFGKVIEKQSLQVDTISGATITCKTHLKAVENALEAAMK